MARRVPAVFSPHAAVGIATNQRAKLERLCRYVSRPPVGHRAHGADRIGHVRYTLETPYRDGTW